MTWGEDVARQRIRRSAAHGGTRLKLNSLDLASVPEEVRALRRLERLDLSDNLLEDLPDWLGELDCLTDLELGGNGLTVIPPWLCDLSRLTHLCLNDNLFTELPDRLGELTSLVRLHLGANDFAQLPDWIGDLPNLRDLKLQDLRMRSIVVLTDGYTPWPGESPGPRVIAGIFGKPSSRYSEESEEVEAVRLPPGWVETVYLR